MRTVLMLCGLSVFPCVTFADPADLPNANLSGNSATLPNSNLPGSVPDDHPVSLPNTDTTPPPPVYWPAWWWPFQPTARLREPPPAPSPEQADVIARLQRQLAAARARSHTATLNLRAPAEPRGATSE